MASGVEPIPPGRSEWVACWALDPDVVMLNHGSFGACPRVVLEAQERFRRQMELEPVRFFMRQREPLLDAARLALARFLGAKPADMVFVRNATEGVNSVLRSLTMEPGDETLVPEGVEGLMRRNHELVALGRKALCEALGSEPLCPEEMLGSMAAVRLPDSRESMIGWIHPVQRRLYDQFRIEVPVFAWPEPPRLLLRISAQAYNHVDEFGQLAEAVRRVS